MCMASRAESLRTCTINSSLEKRGFQRSTILVSGITLKVQMIANLKSSKNCETTLIEKIHAFLAYLWYFGQSILEKSKLHECHLVCQGVFVFVSVFVYVIVSWFVFVPLFVFVFAEIQLVASHQCVTQSCLGGKKSIRSSAGAGSKT